MHKIIKQNKTAFSGELHIIGNNHYIPMVYHWELTNKELADFDWTTSEDTFFRYKGNTYCIADFMCCEKHSPFYPDFDGYASDSFFSGTLVKYPDPDDLDYGYGGYIKAYRYYC